MRPTIYSPAEIEAIAARYDGSSETLEALLSEFGGKRHNIHAAAKKGGYKTRRQRKQWTPEDDELLRANWGRMPSEELARLVNATEVACNLRRRRLGFSTRDFVEYTVHDVEALLKIDHRHWQRFIEEGRLKAWQQPRRNREPVQRISVENLRRFLTDYPEVFDYRRADAYVRGVLELDTLPNPPAYKRLTCRSEAYDKTERPGVIGKRVHHGEKTLTTLTHNYELESCQALGGTDFWAPLYEVSPSCPRCGCKVSRFSEKALYCDTPPDGEHMAILADKLGLRYAEGRFLTPAGAPLSDEDLLRYVFSTRRRPSKALMVFRRLLESGLNVAPVRPVPAERLLPSPLGYSLRPRQKAAYAEFLETGAVGIYWPPGSGKMYILGHIYACLPGTHALFVHSDTIFESWVQHLSRYAPQVRVRKVWSPNVHHAIEVFEGSGELRCAIEVWNYKTRFNFEGRRYVVIGYDEAHFLPGKNAHRLSMLPSDYRVGLTATPFREDGQADLIQVMSGRTIGDDWAPMREAGEIKTVPVCVRVVRDLEHKYAELRRYLGRVTGQVLVFSDSLEDGERIARENGVPFLSGASTERLSALASHRIVAISRIGDCGMDLPDLAEVIEFNFHHGSRAQSLQRYGRLLHAKNPVQHTVLMTHKEISLYHKRLTALEQKGFSLRIEVCPDEVSVVAQPTRLPTVVPGPASSILSTLLQQLAA